MRVTHLSRPESGGATLYARTLDEGLRQRGFDSRVVTQNDLLSDAAVPQKNRQRFLNRCMGRLYSEAQTASFHSTNRFREFDLKQLLHDCDLVHIHQATNWLGLSNLFNDIPSTTPVVVSLHDLWAISGGCVVYQGCDQYRESCDMCPILKAPFNRLLAKRQLRLKAGIYDRDNLSFIANSEWTKDQMHGASVIRSDHKISVIHPAVDTVNFSPVGRINARKSLNISDDTFVICSGAAAITDTNKNVPAVLRAVANLRIDRKIKMLIFGDGMLSVPDSVDVQFLGPLESKSQLACAYKASDVFVSASKMETYGMTLIEAMACESPPIAFRTGAIPGVVCDQQNGLLVDLEDEGALSAAIESLVSNEEKRAQLGRAARQTVVERNAVDVLVDQHIVAYTSAMSR